jgi:hypothetical protein
MNGGKTGRKINKIFLSSRLHVQIPAFRGGFDSFVRAGHHPPRRRPETPHLASPDVEMRSSFVTKGIVHEP